MGLPLRREAAPGAAQGTRGDAEKRRGPNGKDLFVDTFSFISKKFCVLLFAIFSYIRATAFRIYDCSIGLFDPVPAFFWYIRFGT